MKYSFTQILNQQELGIVAKKVYDMVRLENYHFNQVCTLDINGKILDFKICEMIPASKFRYLRKQATRATKQKPDFTKVFEKVKPEVIFDIMSQSNFYTSSNPNLIGRNIAKLSSTRLKLFKREMGNLECVCCGRKGSEFRLETLTASKIRPHFNLYSEDNVLMTKDHIIPASLGGSDGVDNMQIMCSVCNGKKGNNVTEEDLKNGKFKKLI